MHRQQGLDLDAGAARAPDRGGAVHLRALPVKREIDIDAGKLQRVAKGYKIGSALCGLDGRDRGNRDNRTLSTLGTFHRIQNLRTDPHASRSHRLPDGLRLVTGVDHAGVARTVKMSEPSGRHAAASIRHAWRAAAALLIWLALALGPATALGQGANKFDLLSDEQLEIFQRDLARYHFGSELLDDPVSELYIRRLLTQLDPPERTAIFIIEDSSINALAVWGNMIFIHTGLIEFIDNESELFAVIAHEVGHIVQEHFERLPKQLQTVSSLAAAALILGIFSTDAEIGDALIAASQGGLQAAAYEQIRTYEYEADSIAIDLLSRAETGADGLISVLRKLKGAPGVPEYLRSHPISDNRVAAVKGYARQLPDFEPRAEGVDFGFIRARIRKRSRVTNLSEQVSDEPEDIQDYLLLLDKGQGSAAAGQRLQERYPGNWIVAHALADFHLSENRTDEAERVLAQALGSDPDNQVLVAMRLEALTQAGDSQQAMLALGKLSSLSYGSPLVAKAEAQFWAKGDDDYRYRVALSRYNYSRGDMDGARQQISFARDVAEKSGRDDSHPQLVRLEEKIDSIEKALGISQGQADEQ